MKNKHLFYVLGIVIVISLAFNIIFNNYHNYSDKPVDRKLDKFEKLLSNAESNGEFDEVMKFNKEIIDQHPYRLDLRGLLVSTATRAINKLDEVTNDEIVISKYLMYLDVFITQGEKVLELNNKPDYLWIEMAVSTWLVNSINVKFVIYQRIENIPDIDVLISEDMLPIKLNEIHKMILEIEKIYTRMIDEIPVAYKRSRKLIALSEESIEPIKNRVDQLNRNADMLRKICNMIYTLIDSQEKFKDQDLENDGIMDYATSLDQIIEAGILDKLYMEIYQGYKFSIINTQDGSYEYWAARATPIQAGKIHLYLEKGGEIRWERGKIANKESQSIRYKPE